MNFEEQLNLILRGVVDVFSKEELEKKLKYSINNEKPLRVKLGIDPTAPDIHLGHTVVLRKLAHFQKCGHKAVIIIGDCTALIGDPSGRDKTRPSLNNEKIKENAETYLEQIRSVVDVDNAEIVYNSEWLMKLNFKDIIGLASQITVARLIERDDFSNRYKKGIPIGVHEFLYPLMQGYDSVAVKADVELGGTDQTYNLLAGRDLQKNANMEPQVALTMPIIPGLDGVRKMSKSYNNHIGIYDKPNEMFAKIMSIPDTLIKDYLTLLSDSTIENVDERLMENPYELKKELGRIIVDSYHENGAGIEAENAFIELFKKDQVPDDIPVCVVDKSSLKDGKFWIPMLLKIAEIAPSTSQGKRLLLQGSVYLNGNKLNPNEDSIALEDDMIFRVGKKRRYFKIKLK